MIKCMCGHAKNAAECQVIELTAEEKLALLQVNEEVPDKCYYCPPCAKLLQDPEQAAVFMRNTYEQQLRQIGVPKARQLADTYHRKLIELTRKAKHGTQA